MSIGRLIKRFLPTSLFGRALMILIVPVVILQLMIAYIFYERHWDSVVRNLSSAASGNVALLVNEFERNRILLGSEAAMERTMEALHICRRKMDERNVSRTRLVSTEACRAAASRARISRRRPCRPNMTTGTSADGAEAPSLRRNRSVGQVGR